LTRRGEKRYEGAYVEPVERRSMNRMRSMTFASVFLMTLLAAPALRAQEAPKPAPPQHPLKVYPDDYDKVWGDVVAVLTEKGLADHPHGKMQANKETGKITTPTFRYFRIFSASPVKEIDYRDTYTILVGKADAVPAPEKQAAPKEGAKEGAAEAPKPAPPAGKSSGVKVEIQRKFEIYDTEKKAWVDADPHKEEVGITAEALFQALDSKLHTADVKDVTSAVDTKETAKNP
jgi:hypothetical protein